jgi:hypothetical protein
MLRLHDFAQPLSGLAVFALLAQASACPANEPERVAPGSWGGQHMGMVVSDTGAILEYDCATGVITVPLLLNESGEFSWTGTHSPGHGGPVRVDEPPDVRPARYSGRVSGNTMTLTLTLADNSLPPQEYTLVRGATAHVFRCL